jgi:hypothetical protein
LVMPQCFANEGIMTSWCNQARAKSRKFAIVVDRKCQNGTHCVKSTKYPEENRTKRERKRNKREKTKKRAANLRSLLFGLVPSPRYFA